MYFAFPAITQDTRAILVSAMSARMNGSVTTDAESDHSTEAEEEQDPVTPRCDALRDLAAVIQEVSYQPALPDNVTKTYLQKVIDYLLLSDYCEKFLETQLTPLVDTSVSPSSCQ